MSAWTPRQDLLRSRALHAAGLWQSVTIVDYARRVYEEEPDRILIIDDAVPYSASRLFTEAEALAGALQARGLVSGDVVSYALPNWYESVVLSLATAMSGLVIHPLLPMYRERELEFMLGNAQSRILFIPQIYRSVDYPQLLTRIHSKLPALKDLVVVRGNDPRALCYEGMIAQSRKAAAVSVDADSVKMLIYTSGTTGDPKGVMHSHNSIFADVRSLARFWRVTTDDCFFVPSPVTHIGGSLYAHEFIWFGKTKAVLQDRWAGDKALENINAYGCTISAGATPFLNDLVEASRKTGVVPATLRLFICGGAAVPPALIRAAHQQFPRCVPCRVYGLTEVPTITAGTDSQTFSELCSDTDGEICGTDVLIVDPETEAPLAPGLEGEIWVKGPEMLMGYTRDSDNQAAFGKDGYFKTGDLGHFVGTKHLVITGRKKDLIIRAGENISPKEIEDVLGEDRRILDVAVVAVPSRRTGEAACACIVLQPGASLTLNEIANLMTERGWAKQKIPEALLILDSLPRTATGKVRKDDLRHRAAAALMHD